MRGGSHTERIVAFACQLPLLFQVGSKALLNASVIGDTISDSIVEQGKFAWRKRSAAGLAFTQTGFRFFYFSHRPLLKIFSSLEVAFWQEWDPKSSQNFGQASKF